MAASYRKKVLKEQGKIVSRGDRTSQSERWRAKEGNLLKNRAHQKVYVAVCLGRIKKPKKCSLCPSKKFIQAHHKDYSKPLRVQWLCSECHIKLHRREELKMKIEKCRCGHSWTPRVEKPKTCPKCKNYLERKNVKNK